MLWKQADFSNLQFRSRIWKLDRFIACNLWKQVTLCVHNDFDRFMFQKTKNKNKKYFPKSFLQCFSSKNVLTEHKEVCLSIDSAQPVRLEKRTTEFKNYFKQIPVSFKVYTDFECNLESVENYEGSYSKKHQDHIPCSFAYKLVCVEDKFSKLIVVFRGEGAAFIFIEAILKEYEYCKQVMKTHFNKNLIMIENNFN